MEEAQSVTAILAEQCPNPRLSAVGISEILINAIEHGNLHITYQEKTRLHESAEWLAEIDRRLALPENKRKYVTVIFKRTPKNLNIRVTDCGTGFNWQDYMVLDNKRVFDNHGRGLIMARNLAFSEMIYHGNGNEVECIVTMSS